MKRKLFTVITMTLILSGSVACSNTSTPTAEIPTFKEPTAEATFDLNTDEGICAGDAAMTSLELNDALAPLLGISPDREVRSVHEDDVIRAHKNAAFTRACIERANDGPTVAPPPPEELSAEETAFIEEAAKVTVITQALKDDGLIGDFCNNYTLLGVEEMTAALNLGLGPGNEISTGVVNQVAASNC